MELQLSSLFLPRLHLLPLTLLILGFSTFSQSSVISETKKANYNCTPLLIFREVLSERNSENANLSSWRDTNSCSTWNGFTWKSLTLNLSGFNLTGNLISLSTELPLHHIDLSDNNFFGNIPTKLYEYGNLSSLNLSHNAFNGSLAKDVSSPCLLNSLDVSFNDLSGEIPSSLRSCKQLEFLLLQNNSFNGIIPGSLGNLENLKKLNLSNNNLSGGIPSLGNLENLTQLSLSNNNLSGGIPSSLGACKQLEFLLLQDNHFNGTIPRSLGNLENLEKLDLSNNNLSGQVPTRGIFNDSTSFVYHGNGNLCGGVGGLKLPPCSNGGKSSSNVRNILIIAIVASAFSLLLLSWVLYRCSAKGSRLKHRSPLGGGSRVTYTYDDLHEATKGFSSTNLIGSGSIGSVYRGFLENERRAVAIKVFKKEVVGDPDRFLEESRDLMKIGRSNLVGIVATCVDLDGVGDPFVALVYELMPNGNLAMWLHKKVVSKALNFRKWNLSLYQRLNVAIDVASALAHLHLPSERAVFLCNLKPSNVLLAEDMTASLTDFGMHRIFATNDIVANSKGYISPECGMGRAPSSSGDVYSFGVLLLEMFTRKKPAKIYSRQGVGLHRYVQQRFALDLDGVVDPLLLSEETGGKLTDRSRGCINSVIKIALSCSNENPIDRMGIKNALQKLEQVKLSYLEIGSGGTSPRSSSGPSGSSDAMLP